MLVAKVLIYTATIAAAFFFAFWESKLKRQLTDEAADNLPESMNDLGIVNDLRKRMVRERFLSSLPRQRLLKFRVAVGLKFLFFVLLIIEVIVLQR